MRDLRACLRRIERSRGQGSPEAIIRGRDAVFAAEEALRAATSKEEREAANLRLAWLVERVPEVSLQMVEFAREVRGTSWIVPADEWERRKREERDNASDT